LEYQPVKNLVMRTGFGLFYAPSMQYGGYQGFGTNGYTQTTPWVGTLDGITPTNLLSNPFPTGLLPITGNSAGGLTNVGQFSYAPSPFRPTPYVNEWVFGLEYELTKSDKVSATYVGNHGVKLLTAAVNRDEMPPQDMAMGSALLDQVTNPFAGIITQSGCGLNNPTVIRAQLLLPYPEYCELLDPNYPMAISFYNAVTMEWNHRWSHGMQLLASYTISKFEDNNVGNEGWTAGNANLIRNYYNMAAEKSLDTNDIPQSLVLTYLYELPYGRGRHFGTSINKPLDAVLGGWQVSGITTFKKGFPLSIGAANDNSYSFGGGGQRPNIVGDPHISNPTINEWFNTAAFAQPSAFTWGDGPRSESNLRAPGINNWDMSIQKYWRKQERLSVQLGFEMFNAFNHVDFYAPGEDLGLSNFGIISATMQPRTAQARLKIVW
jgi:hypothetical protein